MAAATIAAGPPCQLCRRCRTCSHPSGCQLRSLGLQRKEVVWMMMIVVMMMMIVVMMMMMMMYRHHSSAGRPAIVLGAGNCLSSPLLPSQAEEQATWS